MFNVQLEQIFTKTLLKDSFLEISSKSSGLDEVSYNEFKINLSKSNAKRTSNRFYKR